MSLRLIKYFRFPSFTGSDWTTRNPLLERGEIGYQLDSGATEIIGAKVGPGLWNSLGYFGQKLIPKTLRLNVTGAASSASGVGFEIEEGGSVTGYFKTNSARTGFLFNTPASSYDGEFLFSSLNANRSYTLPDASGTIALVESTVAKYLMNGKIWVGDAGDLPSQVTMSGDGTISNTGVLTVGPLSLTTKVTGILPVANGGTGTSTVLTQGQVVFAGASGIYSGTNEFTWNNTNKKLSVNYIDIFGFNSNTFIGAGAGNTTVTGYSNTVFGSSSPGYQLTSGSYNCLFGVTSGFALTSGSDNSFIGQQSGQSTTTGSENIGIGTHVLTNNITGSSNIAIGFYAGISSVSTSTLTFPSDSIFIGKNTQALNDGGTNEIVIGNQAVGNGSNTITFGNSYITANYFTGSINLLTTPTSDASVTKLLTYDSVSKTIKYRDASTIVAAGSGHTIYNGASALTQRANLTFTNGLSASDNATETLAKLGGTLIENTTISGSFNLNLNSQNISFFSGSPNYNSGTNIVFVAKSSVRPTSPPTDGVYIWAEKNSEILDAGVTRLMVMDSAGNIKAI